MVETDINVAMEWACKLKSEHSGTPEPVALFRNVPRYRGQDIRATFSRTTETIPRDRPLPKPIIIRCLAD